MNDLTNYLEYAKQQHRNAYVVNQTPGDAARNIAMEFMSAGELVKFSLECIACAIRKIRHNDERMHHYQRGRASFTGLMFELREIIGTGRLVVVVMSRLVVLLNSC